MQKLNLKAGTRSSKLAVLQTRNALSKIQDIFPEISFELVETETPGDRDRRSDLKKSPADFFTRDLDNALRNKSVDIAIHSAKDLPDPVSADLDWFWLPWREDPRDVWVLAEGRSLNDLPPDSIIGVSSQRRDECALRRFPDAILKPIRGSIIDRMQQLDNGDFDAVLMAGAAFKRLSLENRITEWIELDELCVPPGQGYLALTFRLGDKRLIKLRNFFTRAVRFVGAGVGTEDYCTFGGIKDIKSAEVCLYDVLMDDKLLRFLPESSERVFVGKRCGDHRVRQNMITQLVANYARQGKRVVRLKGGDPGLFGRLAEETAELDRLSLAYKVRAGVSALTAATTENGLLLTRRSVSRGFCAMTPRAVGGAVAGISKDIRSKLPLVLFMSVRVAPNMARQLITEGWDDNTPASVVFNGGAADQQVITFTLKKLSDNPAELESSAPGLLVIGQVAETIFKSGSGALQGRRVLLTCSESIMDKAVMYTTDFGGKALAFPMIRLHACHDIKSKLSALNQYDWLVLTSPASVNFFMKMILDAGIDVRSIPKIMTCGPGSAQTFQNYGINPNLTPPMLYSAEGLADLLSGIDFKGQRVLRLRSEKAGTLLADVLRNKGAVVDDELLYRNEFVEYQEIPGFDIVFFASASAADSYVNQAGAASLKDKYILAIGNPTEDALLQHGLRCNCVAAKATVKGAIETLARDCCFL